MIYSVSQNQYGAWVISGVIGTIQYYFYTRKQAMKEYIRMCKAKGETK